MLTGGTGVLFRIDDGSWQLWRGRRIRLAWLAHLQTQAVARSCRSTKGRPPVSPSTRVRSSSRSSAATARCKKGNQQRRQVFERARTLCEKRRERKHACVPCSRFGAARLARVMEAERRYAEAMAEYQSVQGSSLRGNERSELRSGIQRIAEGGPNRGSEQTRQTLQRRGDLAHSRYAQRAGGGKSERVVLRAGDTVQLGRKCR